jgi:hypothetical protein
MDVLRHDKILEDIKKFKITYPGICGRKGLGHVEEVYTWLKKESEAAMELPDFDDKHKLISLINYANERKAYKRAFEYLNKLYGSYTKHNDYTGDWRPRFRIGHKQSLVINAVGNSQFEKYAVARMLMDIGCQTLKKHYDHPSLQLAIRKHRVCAHKVKKIFAEFQDVDFYH